ncbi:mannitol dehydrogenase family protein [Rhizobium leguminosarum]|uniref:Mannitol dehydrogenase domain protein n=1 Tax=Rhizobium leguminosarum bv. trifolii (strain WSM1325) TaxID=395491 RepID=C6B188_RHILS|nr:mannitol dehydrogenase family protein [Rhizobium leguminosarum]ACS58592.1 Mannitol dehydrogenase domain protein [Rhizobium leguminosarum bv. trifolii WSM1325]MBY2912428.1 mannitol dehydrogenase family protein [Rhizobium leguminosarum]MBY2913856.1 mannitol dehydrogenase family protein [Rhizobium leguminosarum]MBY2946243.1 mannitol dehydrogenase family protein [Rhizobium leguminosarum]MBY2969393.1 mannitol dehydrogenase family protein [Rhizobium leguminosarum]
MTERLQTLSGLASTAKLPAYDRDQLKSGILHLGPGAFFRAHFAPFTDAALAAVGGDWGIEVASLRTADVADHLNEQNGLYTMLIRDTSGTVAQVIGPILRAHVATRDPSGLLDRLEDPTIRIVSLTVTEKAYGMDTATGGLDLNHADVAADLANRHAPRGVIGYLVEGLSRRRAKGIAPFTPLSCDNLPSNGAVLKRLVLDFAERVDPSLRQWIEANVPFPSTMVDRITPASTEATYQDAERLTGRQDLAAIETEPFTQWVIEDDFANGRPAWDKAGALMVTDVSAYEKMKLRMLNGAHSLLAYLGYIGGYEFIRDVMDDAGLAALAYRHMHAAARTLDAVPGIDLDDYASELIARFANKAIAHRTYQIAMDGTQKLPQRLLEPATEALAHGDKAETYAIAVAAWMRYAIGEHGNGERYELRDPRAGEIAALIADVPRTGLAISAALFTLPGLFPAALTENRAWTQDVSDKLEILIQDDRLPLF